MYCRTRSFSLNWSRGESSFLGFQNGGRLCIFCVVFAGGCMSGGSILQFKVFGLEVGSGAFPTSFRRVVRFVASWTFWILFLGILPVIAALFLLWFIFSAFILDMSGFFAIVAGNVWSMPEERRPVPCRVAVGAVDIVGTGMSSPPQVH